MFAQQEQAWNANSNSHFRARAHANCNKTRASAAAKNRVCVCVFADTPLHFQKWGAATAQRCNAPTHLNFIPFIWCKAQRIIARVCWCTRQGSGVLLRFINRANKILTPAGGKCTPPTRIKTNGRQTPWMPVNWAAAGPFLYGRIAPRMARWGSWERTPPVYALLSLSSK